MSESKRRSDIAAPGGSLKCRYIATFWNRSASKATDVKNRAQNSALLIDPLKNLRRGAWTKCLSKVLIFKVQRRTKHLIYCTHCRHFVHLSPDFRRDEKSEISPQFSTVVAFDGLRFRNEATCRNVKSGSADVQTCPNLVKFCSTLNSKDLAQPITLLVTQLRWKKQTVKIC